MKLDYATLISPYPLFIQGAGNVRSPTLKDIWNPQITYKWYEMFLYYLYVTPQSFFNNMKQNTTDIIDEPDTTINMFHLVMQSQELQEIYRKVFDFFLVESVFWDNESKIFITYVENDTQVKAAGTIHVDNFDNIRDIILQRCGAAKGSDDYDPKKIENSKAYQIYQKIEKGRKKTDSKKHAEHDPSLELPNLISAISVYSNSINFINVWDLTVFQLQEQFKREMDRVFFDIRKTNIAAYGDEKKTFTGREWYRNNGWGCCKSR